VRFIAFLLVVLAGGLSWLLLINGPETLMGGLPLEFILPEGFTSEEPRTAMQFPWQWHPDWQSVP